MSIRILCTVLSLIISCQPALENNSKATSLTKKVVETKNNFSRLSDNHIHLQGATFGTTFNIKIILPSVMGKDSHDNLNDKLNNHVLLNKDKHIIADNVQNLRKKLMFIIRKRLQEIDESMSNWRSDSEVSRFNNQKSKVLFIASEDFYKVVKVAKKINDLSEGTFDPAKADLFELWGFGPKTKARERRVPKKQEIQKYRKQSNMAQLNLLTGNKIRKQNPQLHLNLSALAKGYAVDEIAKLLKHLGLSTYMVEIGGEVKVGEKSLRKKEHASWHIGIEYPHYTTIERSLWSVVYLKNIAMASSGSYRNYHKIANEHYTHIINPHTGYPIATRVTGVSVVGPNCMWADALATTLMVMELASAKKLIEKLSDYEALWIIEKNSSRSKNKSYVQHVSSGMNIYLKK